ncbi:uncharacterized protein TNCV_4119401 [Trichonephila clavipes]|nr:uncharacterized protein TNCV_4119401 [Trichonephila clavipes]
MFEGSLAVGKNVTNYDGEALAVFETTTHLLSAGLAPSKVIFFIDSQAAILALSGNIQTGCLKTIHCRNKSAELISYSWIGPHSEFQVMLGSAALKESTEKQSRERSQLNRKPP